jgi:hypothetical protein
MAKDRKKPMVEPARRGGSRRGRHSSAGPANGAATAAALPDWSALSEVAPRRRAKAASPGSSRLTTARFALWLFGIGIATTLYVGHVHATQDLFERLHALRKENLRLHLERDRLKGELDHALGPTVIYPKANALGLHEGFEYGPTLKLMH